MADRTARAKRNANILADLAAGMTVVAVCRRYKLSENSIYKIRRSPRQSPPAASRYCHRANGIAAADSLPEDGEMTPTEREMIRNRIRYVLSRGKSLTAAKIVELCKIHENKFLAVIGTAGVLFDPASGRYRAGMQFAVGKQNIDGLRKSAGNENSGIPAKSVVPRS